jgi:catechol 2,3-dioxygenase-like lactoylglutathione lyase family enzyme
MSEQRFDRAVDDIGNLVEIGHVNVNIPDQLAATDFYVTALGLTRDPYLFTGTNNMWVNIGRHQFHLPTGPRGQRLHGVVGLVVPDLAALRARFGRARLPLTEVEGGVEVVSPWGNRIRAHAPDPRFGPVTLALAYVEHEVPPGAAEPIAAFYREIVGAPSSVSDGAAHVRAGWQELIFRETGAPIPPNEGHHIQVYLADFSTPHRKLLERGLITAENNAHEYRFAEIIDLGDGRSRFTLEHEMRSMRHPLFGRTLVNRDTTIDPLSFVTGREAFAWASASR